MSKLHPFSAPWPRAPTTTRSAWPGGDPAS